MRFDDSLRTVLAADTTTAFGAQSAFRQLVDLIGRRRVDATGLPLARLRELRAQVPAAVRAASARSLALADPPVELVTFFAEDDRAIAEPVLRSARLNDEEWLSLLPRIGPAGRAVLRGRDNLAAGVVRGLEAFGATDFTIAHEKSEADPAFARPELSPITEPVPDEVDGPQPAPPGQTFAIAELVERIETFQRVREQADPPTQTASRHFAFETDPAGAILWVDGVGRAGLIGRKIGALDRLRPTRLVTGTIEIDGAGMVGGGWTFSATAMFEASSRFIGYRGSASRAVSPAIRPPIEPEALRRLVHELRTPTNAIAGFAELISTEMFGPAPEPYRIRATAIERDVEALIGAIEDLEISARIDGQALELSPQVIDLDSALATAVERATGEARLRAPARTGTRVVADERALDRLLVRLYKLAAGEAAGEEPTEITVQAEMRGVAIGWPRRASGNTTPLLGADFSLRLVQRLAVELGGTLVIEPERLTLHLPASFNGDVKATIN